MTTPNDIGHGELSTKQPESPRNTAKDHIQDVPRLHTTLSIPRCHATSLCSTRCYLNSSASQELPVWGYGLRYKYGIFQQLISPEGNQLEAHDPWLANQNPWEPPRLDVTYDSGGQEVLAVAYDVMIPGCYTKTTTNTAPAHLILHHHHRRRQHASPPPGARCTIDGGVAEHRRCICPTYAALSAASSQPVHLLRTTDRHAAPPLRRQHVSPPW
ncbi:hypothetical protein C8J57DRAFT_1650936 [Mycena rebaudengoi]|nr:hypothetical protein C8J57DRAFT_1650936 [Mycena rebaudengoi]